MRVGSALIPIPESSYEAARRYRHGDLHELSDRKLRAEQVLIRHELARQIFFQIDAPYGCSGDTVRTQRDWLEQRANRIDAELRRRDGR